MSGQRAALHLICSSGSSAHIVVHTFQVCIVPNVPMIGRVHNIIMIGLLSCLLLCICSPVDCQVLTTTHSIRPSESYCVLVLQRQSPRMANKWCKLIFWISLRRYSLFSLVTVFLIYDLFQCLLCSELLLVVVLWALLFLKKHLNKVLRINR